MWTDSVDGEWPGIDEKVRTNIDTRVTLIGPFMCKYICDFTNYWKCYPEITLYEYKQNTFQPIEESDLFVDGGKKLLEIANKKVADDYQRGQGKEHDCFVGMNPPGTVDWKNVSISFGEKGIFLSYYFDSGSYCDAENWSDTLVAWNIVEPLLKTSIKSTPNFCTPSGLKVNVRAEESAKAEVLFQLDKGEFFEILETGKTDKVNGKSGSWYKINFEGKTGYIFSFYTLCK